VGNTLGWTMAPAFVWNSTQRGAGRVELIPPCPDSPGTCAGQERFEFDLIQAVSQNGPFIVYVDATNWQLAGKGIFPAQDRLLCSARGDAANHVVQLVGFGHENGMAYWIIKNSWGEDWGDKGYLKLPLGINACGIANFVVRGLGPNEKLDLPTREAIARLSQQASLPDKMGQKQLSKHCKKVIAGKHISHHRHMHGGKHGHHHHGGGKSAGGRHKHH